MSTSKRPSVLDRALQAVPAAAAAPAVQVARPSAAKTGPGALMGFMQRESEIAQENVNLREELKTWDGANPSKPLDPHLIRPSAWANRDEASYRSQAFMELRAELKEAGGNIQPIKVRPIPATEPQEYEIVFGHRRHRGCLEEGLQVLAIVEAIDDQALYVEMERENRNREDLSPYEQGQMYERGVALFGGVRKLAEQIHRDISAISKARVIAQLPEHVLNAFNSRNEIQFRWAKPLADAVEANAEKVKASALKIAEAKQGGKGFTSTEIFELMTRSEIHKGDAAVQEVAISVAGKKVGMCIYSKGRVRIDLERDVVAPGKVEALSKAIGKALS